MSTNAAIEQCPMLRHIGARLHDDGRCSFRVWAPSIDALRLKVYDPVRMVDMLRDDDGYHSATLDDIVPMSRYAFVFPDERERPDPASRCQPDGVHGPSAVADLDVAWSQQRFDCPPLAEHVIYELHVGTFTPDGTFDAVIDRLNDLQAMGITTLQLMPVAQFPGTRNWGYDGVALFAAQHSYGGVQGLQRLVDACHGRGMSVFLDVVYNHLGPEGNYLREFGPYFTDRYHTPWGDALNFDGPESDHVRAFFIHNALYWIDECRIDGLRLDALHAIVDNTPRPFIEELAAAVHRRAEELDRRVHVIAESAANDARLLRPSSAGGFGMDAQWNDDFHHVLHVLLTDETAGYYQSYDPATHLQKLYDDGFAYTGEYSPFHRRRHGRPAADIPCDRFVVFSQNHDQIGNRMLGERLATLAGLDGARLAAALVLLSPFVPMLFMGEEYADPAPFLYFVDHGDKELLDAVREGRRREFESFAWQTEPPDPGASETFQRSMIDWSLRTEGEHAQMLALYRDLIELRRTCAALQSPAKEHTVARHDTHQNILTIEYGPPEVARLAVIANVVGHARTIQAQLHPGNWTCSLDTADQRYGGPGATADAALTGPEASLHLRPYAIAVYQQGV